MNRVILDTDIELDCDDTGALAVLHTLKKRGAVDISGVICSIPHKACAACVWAINKAYCCEDIPVGLINIPDWEENNRYDFYHNHYKETSAMVPNPVYNTIISETVSASVPDMVFQDAGKLYRSLLADSPDKGTTICAIGTMSALEQLLTSEPDEINDLPGKELISKKVNKLVSMAIADYPEGQDRYNWKMDLIAAEKVINERPTDIIISSAGDNILTGEKMMQCTSPEHPVNMAYQIFLKGRKIKRPSWDQITTIYSCLGAGSIFNEIWAEGLTLEAQTGIHKWIKTGISSRRGYILPQVKNEDLEEYIEELMMEGMKI